MADERPYRDTVTLPSVLVMPGDPWPAAFYARCPQAFRVPVRIVWREGTSRGSAPPSPRDPALAEATPEAAGAPVAAAAAVPAVGSPYGGGDPVGAFLRINDALDRVAGTPAPRPGRRRSVLTASRLTRTRRCHSRTITATTC